jgi:hypothetical protein
VPITIPATVCVPSEVDRLGRVVAGADALGQAPVDHDGVAVRADQDVAGLEIAVDDAVRVGVRHRLGGAQEVGQERQPRVERGGGGERVAEVAALDGAHREERLAAGPAPGVVHRHDRRMLQRGGDHHLAHEAALVAATAQHLLHDHGAAEVPVARAADAPEPAARQLALIDVTLRGRRRRAELARWLAERVAGR